MTKKVKVGAIAAILTGMLAAGFLASQGQTQTAAKFRINPHGAQQQVAAKFRLEPN